MCPTVRIDSPRSLRPRAWRPRFLQAAAAAAALALSSPAAALGILYCREPRIEPIRLGTASVETEITNNIAKTRVTQEFINPNHRQLEADFLFPIPRGANVTDFVLYMNGKPVKGEVLEKDKAREIYENIVRTMKDPGLLEWVDHDLFKVRVFPVPANGTQKIELEFAQPLTADQGTFRYTFPLKRAPGETAAAARAHKADISFAVTIRADEPIRNAHSPTHPVDIDMGNPKAVKVAVADNAFESRGDFVLYYEPSAKDVALSLLSTRDEGTDGFFCLMLSPPADEHGTPAVPTDYVFVLDTSGSMLDDDKIAQARRALASCVAQLGPDDRFNIVRFSSSTTTFDDGLVAATPEGRNRARRWIDDLKASGGTNISEALETALTQRKDAGSGRVFTIVLITDGLPTVGITAPERILDIVKAGDNTNIRVFTFGVGYDVNAKLLDQLADESRASSDYVKPGEDLEVPVSRFFAKISRPAMTNLSLEIPGGDVYDMYPKRLPDLFHGTQLTVFGRYRKPGQSVIRLKGRVDGQERVHEFEKSLVADDLDARFIENLWATRKIAYLLDEIRLNGESKELKDEVVALAKRYSIATPYTSFLVTEDTVVASPPTRGGIRVRPADPQPPRIQPWGWPAAAAREQRAESPVADRDLAMSSASSSGAPAVPAITPTQSSGDIGRQSGEAAVSTAKAIRAMKSAQSVADNDLSMGGRNAGGRQFVQVGSTWVQVEAVDKAVDLKIKTLSDAYFAAIRIQAPLGQMLALGDNVRVIVGGKVIEFGSEGLETLDLETETLFRGEKN